MSSLKEMNEETDDQSGSEDNEDAISLIIKGLKKMFQQ